MDIHSVIIIPEIVTGHRMHSDQTRDTCPGVSQVSQYYQENASPPRKSWRCYRAQHSLLSDALWYLGFSGTRDKWWGDQITKLLQVLQLFVSSPNGDKTMDKTAHLFLWRFSGGQKLDKTLGVRLMFIHKYLGHLETGLKTRFNWPRRIAPLFCWLCFCLFST